MCRIAQSRRPLRSSSLPTGLCGCAGCSPRLTCTDVGLVPLVPGGRLHPAGADRYRSRVIGGWAVATNDHPRSAGPALVRECVGPAQRCSPPRSWCESPRSGPCHRIARVKAHAEPRCLTTSLLLPPCAPHASLFRQRISDDLLGGSAPRLGRYPWGYSWMSAVVLRKRPARRDGRVIREAGDGKKGES